MSEIEQALAELQRLVLKFGEATYIKFGEETSQLSRLPKHLLDLDTYIAQFRN